MISNLVQARERLILALDLPSASQCFRLLDQFEQVVPSALQLLWVKVGLELYLAEGPSVVRELRARGYRVFLDLKFHDIPNTVAGAVRSVLPLEPALLTVHASGGPAMLSAAAEAAAGSQTRLLAVTVLTSMDGRELAAVGAPPDAAHQVARLGLLAVACGMNGLVCSALEAGELRRLAPEVHLVTPGIRPASGPAGDQRRVTTPEEALRSGADQIVVGRPVTAADDPPRAYMAILEQVAAALENEKRPGLPAGPAPLSNA